MAEGLRAAARALDGILRWTGAEGSRAWFTFGEERSDLCCAKDELLGAMRTRRPRRRCGNRAGGGERDGGLGCVVETPGVLAGAGGVCSSRRTAD